MRNALLQASFSIKLISLKDKKRLSRKKDSLKICVFHKLYGIIIKEIHLIPLSQRTTNLKIFSRHLYSFSRLLRGDVVREKGS